MRTLLAFLTLLFVGASAQAQTANPINLAPPPSAASQSAIGTVISTNWAIWLDSAGSLWLSNRSGGTMNITQAKPGAMLLNGVAGGTATYEFGGLPTTGDGILMTTTSASHTWGVGDNVALEFGDNTSYFKTYFSQQAEFNNYNGYQFKNTSGANLPMTIGSSQGGIGGTTTVAMGGNINATTLAGATMIVTGTTIDGQNHPATNFSAFSGGNVTNTSLTASRVVLTDANKGEVSAAASGSSVGVAGDGSAITFGSGLSLSGGTLTATAGAGWLLAGNSGLAADGSQFLGTTDGKPLFFKVDGVTVGWFSPQTVFGSRGPDIVLGGGNSTITNTITSKVAGDGNAIVGGIQNLIQGASDAGIFGGIQNTIQTNSSFSVILGGSSSINNSNAGSCAIIAGNANVMGNSASVLDSVILGGINNTNYGTYSTVLNGGNNAILGGNQSVVGGLRAKCSSTSAFVWSDSTAADFSDLGQDTFDIRSKAFFLTNSAASGSFATFTNGAWSLTGGSGGGFTNKNLTASRMIMTDANTGQASASASGAVPINADGSATTGNQLRGFITNHIVGKSYALIAQNTTSFWAPQGNAVTNIQTSDVDMQSRQAIGTGFQVVGLWIKASQAAGAGQNYTITVMTNGVATAIAPAISGASATTASQFTSIPIVEAQGDSIGIKIVTSATATTNTRFDWDVMFINQ